MLGVSSLAETVVLLLLRTYCYDAAVEAMLLAVLKWCHKEMTSTKKEASHRERGRLIRCILRKFPANQQPHSNRETQTENRGK